MNAEDEKRVKELIRELIDEYGSILQGKVVGADEALSREIADLRRRIAELEKRKIVQL